ncbi:hypothetical protein WJX84_008922, partial [Apatococcus fuscideae]
MKGTRRLEVDRGSLKSNKSLRVYTSAGSSKSDLVKSESRASPQPRRKRAALGLGDPVSFSEDSSDSTGDNWHSLHTLGSGPKSPDLCAQEPSDDKAYSLRPRKQSKTNSLTARTKAEAAVDNAEQKMAYAAQLVLAVQRCSGKESIATLPSPAAAVSQARPMPSSSGASSVKLVQSNGTIETGLPHAASAADQRAFPGIGRQLLAASPASGRICLAEVLNMDMTDGRCRLLWQDGYDGWILPQEHGVQWLDIASAPVHAACPGIAEGTSGQALVGSTLDIFEVHLAEFAPALVTAYDHRSDTHTLLSDDLGVQDRCLSSVTFRLLESSDNVQQTGNSDPDFFRPSALWTSPKGSGWGSCSNLRLDNSHLCPADQQSFTQPQQQ